MTDMMPDHTPHPGSSRDAVATAHAHTHHPEHEHGGVLEPESVFVVQTRSDMPEETIPRTLTLSSSNPYLAALPRDMRRRRAVILAIDNDVILAESKELAQSIATQVGASVAAANLSGGFYLSKAVPLVLESRDWMFIAATTTGSASRVSVVVERYAEPLGG